MKALTLLVSLTLGCASQQLETCRANAGANHLMRLKVECIEQGYTIDACPHMERIDAQFDEEWAACQ